MILGIDVSTYLEQQRISKQKYYKGGKEVDPFELFKNNGVTYIRTRVWNNPYSESGEPYLGGTCDVNNFIELATKLKKYGFHHILDFHYSDFWCDPSKQFLPKAWQGLSFEEVLRELRKFTIESLTKIKKAGIEIDYVQPGNEITHGMLWPYAKIMGGEEKEASYDRFALSLNTAIEAIHEVYPSAKIILHLEQSYDQEAYRDILSNLFKRNVKIDVLGSSYYPFWHHGFDEYFANMDMVQREFHIPVMNIELGYPFTTIDYRVDDNGKAKHLVINADNIDDYLKLMPYYPDKEGQAQFVRDFISLAKKHNLSGICFWEPLWVPGEGICWGSKAGQAYQNDTSKDTRNEWANQCLFDYEANALPALDYYKL